MGDTTVIEVEHFIVRLKLRMLFDLTYVSQVQNVALLALKDQVLNADLDVFVLHIFFCKVLRIKIVTAFVEVNFCDLLLVLS